MFNIFEEKATEANLRKFAQQLMALSEQIGFKVSARGWCYQLETSRLINKDQFDRVESVINKCRKRGILPIDFVAEEEGRQFSGVERPEEVTPLVWLKQYIEAPLRCHEWYTPDWWIGEEYYIQMLVEKIDLKTLFAPVCEMYHIPIATSKGWSSMLQRATYARRFKDAEKNGLKCVLLYCGDHDPDGLRISEFIRRNLADISSVNWEDGEEGYDPQDLIIERFGLNADFIFKHKLTWIDNLTTGSEGYIAEQLPDGRIVAGRTKQGRPHKNFPMQYIQEYLKKYGVRKCEANAIVPMPTQARALVTDAIVRYVDENALSRFEAKKERVKNEMDVIRKESGLEKVINATIALIDRNNQ